MQLWNFTQPTAEICRTTLDLTWSKQQQHMLMEMVYGTTTVASCHLICGQEVTLCEFLRYDLPPFYSLLEDFQHHNLTPEVKYWKPDYKFTTIL